MSKIPTGFSSDALFCPTNESVSFPQDEPKSVIIFRGNSATNMVPASRASVESVDLNDLNIFGDIQMMPGYAENNMDALATAPERSQPETGPGLGSSGSEPVHLTTEAPEGFYYPMDQSFVSNHQSGSLSSLEFLELLSQDACPTMLEGIQQQQQQPLQCTTSLFDYQPDHFVDKRFNTSMGTVPQSAAASNTTYCGMKNKDIDAMISQVFPPQNQEQHDTSVPCSSEHQAPKVTREPQVLMGENFYFWSDLNSRTLIVKAAPTVDFNQAQIHSAAGHMLGLPKNSFPNDPSHALAPAPPIINPNDGDDSFLTDLFSPRPELSAQDGDESFLTDLFSPRPELSAQDGDDSFLTDLFSPRPELSAQDGDDSFLTDLFSPRTELSAQDGDDSFLMDLFSPRTELSAQDGDDSFLTDLFSPTTELSAQDGDELDRKVERIRELIAKRRRVARNALTNRHVRVHEVVQIILLGDLANCDELCNILSFCTDDGFEHRQVCSNFMVRDTKAMGQIWKRLKGNSNGDYDTFARAMRTCRESGKGYFSYLDEGKGSRKRIYKLGDRSMQEIKYAASTQIY